MEFWSCISAKELDFIKCFAHDVACRTGSQALCQLRCLWTAYCVHQSITIGSPGYDTELHQIWAHYADTGEGFESYDKFSVFMAEHLLLYGPLSVTNN